MTPHWEIGGLMIQIAELPVACPGFQVLFSFSNVKRHSNGVEKPLRPLTQLNWCSRKLQVFHGSLGSTAGFSRSSLERPSSPAESVSVIHPGCGFRRLQEQWRHQRAAACISPTNGTMEKPMKAFIEIKIMNNITSSELFLCPGRQW